MVVLGSATDGRVHLVANVAPSVVERGVKAARPGAGGGRPVVGGGGGGRDTLAQAGGKDPEKLDEALATARAEIEKALVLMRVLALDHGSARCGAAISDPTGTLATPLAVGGAAGHARGGSRRSPGWWRKRARSGSSSGFR